MKKEKYEPVELTMIAFRTEDIVLTSEYPSYFECPEDHDYEGPVAG